MKKFWVGLGTGIGLLVAAFLLWKNSTKHEDQATSDILKDLPKEIGMASQEYMKMITKRKAELETAKASEVIEKFKKAFGG